MPLRLSKKEAKRLGLIDNDGNATNRAKTRETAQDARRAPASRIDTPALKSRPVRPQKKMSYERACLLGWQFTYRNIGGGSVACMARNRRLNTQTDWLTDDTDGRGAVLAALGDGEK
jgi:hypothetical protein